MSKPDMARAQATFRDGHDDGVPSYLSRLTQAPLLKADEERSLAVAARAGSREAKYKLIECNMRLVINISRSYHCRSLPLEDLIQEGTLGLIQAIDRFDPERGFRFSTYATHWIRQSIGRAIDGKSKAIRLPSHVSQTLRRIEQVKDQLSRENGTEATIEQISEAMGMSAKRVMSLMLASQDLVSLDVPVGDADSLTLGAMLRDESGVDPESVLISAWIVEELREVMSHLSDRERRVVSMRMKGEDDASTTCVREQLSQELHVSRERIRQIEVQAIKKLRAIAQRRQLSEFVTG